MIHQTFFSKQTNFVGLLPNDYIRHATSDQNRRIPHMCGIVKRCFKYNKHVSCYIFGIMPNSLKISLSHLNDIEAWVKLRTSDCIAVIAPASSDQNKMKNWYFFGSPICTKASLTVAPAILLYPLKFQVLAHLDSSVCWYFLQLRRWTESISDLSCVVID